VKEVHSQWLGHQVSSRSEGCCPTPASFTRTVGSFSRLLSSRTTAAKDRTRVLATAAAGVLSLGRVLNLCKVPKQLNPFCIYRLRSLNLYPRSVAPSLGEAMLFVSPVRYVSSNARMISRRRRNEPQHGNGFAPWFRYGSTKCSGSA